VEIVELEEEEEKETKRGKGKGIKTIALDGTKNIRDMFQKTKSKSKVKLQPNDTIILKPELPNINNIEDTDIFPPKPSKYGKMEMSLLNFKNSYPKWTPMGDSKKQIENFLDNVHAIQTPTASSPVYPSLGMTQIGSESLLDRSDLSISIPPSSSMLSSSIYLGDYSTMALNRDVRLEMEESQKENMQLSLLLFSSNRIMTRQQGVGKQFLPMFV